MKGKLTYILLLAVIALCACERLADDVVVYEGNRTLSPEAQVVAYIPTESVIPTISEVHYWLIQEGTEALLGNESKTDSEDGIYEFDFFSVSVSGESIILDISANTSDCFREITIRFQCKGYDPEELVVTQLPAETAE